MRFDPPIVVNVRDRLTPLRALVEWLERAGYSRILLYDNASTYEPLLDYLRESPHEVVRLGANLGSRGLWEVGVLGDYRGWFVYTDPDTVPIDDCPFDAVEMLREVLDAYPEHTKAALGLYLDDVPETMPSLEWERRLLKPQPGDSWRGCYGYLLSKRPGPLRGADVYDSLSDTTFALYRPPGDFTLQAIRTGWPYQARHLSPAWYGGELAAEDRYYLEHATGGPLGSSWKDAA